MNISLTASPECYCSASHLHNIFNKATEKKVYIQSEKCVNVSTMLYWTASNWLISRMWQICVFVFLLFRIKIVYKFSNRLGLRPITLKSLAYLIQSKKKKKTSNKKKAKQKDRKSPPWNLCGLVYNLCGCMRWASVDSNTFLCLQ